MFILNKKQKFSVSSYSENASLICLTPSMEDVSLDIQN